MKTCGPNRFDARELKVVLSVCIAAFLAFAASCALGSIYGFLQGAWPFGLVEAVWAGVALRRWMLRSRFGI